MRTCTHLTRGPWEGNSRSGWSSGLSLMMAGGRTPLIFGVRSLQVTLLEMKGEGSGGSAGVQCRETPT